MWHWQLSALFKDLFTFSKRQQFFIQLCLLTLFAHLVFLFVMTLVSYGLQSDDRFVVTSQPKSAVYVLSPLQKHVEQQKKKNKRRKKSMTASKVIDDQTYKKELEKQKTTTEQPAKVEQQAVLEISEVKDTVDQKPIEKKSTVPKTVVKPKKASVALTDQKTIQEKKIEEKIVSKSVEEKKVDQNLQKTDLDLDNVTFVGYKDLDHVMIQETIAHVVQQYFKPPAGIDSNVSVELRVQVGDQGKVSKVDVVRSSGIVVYDSSARAAVYKSALPKEVWNKAVSIVLGQ